MKKNIIIILGLAASFALGYFFRSFITHGKVNNIDAKQPVTEVKIKKVTGIGGIFFKCKDVDKMRDWYNEHLGFQTNRYCAMFEWRESDDPSKKGITQWSVFSEKGNYFEPSTKEFMINYRVQDLAGLVEQLNKEGVTIIDSIDTYEYGKFIHILDIEGNKIELWEPDYDYGK